MSQGEREAREWEHDEKWLGNEQDGNFPWSSSELGMVDTGLLLVSGREPSTRVRCQIGLGRSGLNENRLSGMKTWLLKGMVEWKGFIVDIRESTARGI